MKEPKVVLSNIFVLNFLVIASICCMRGVRVLIEQPESSKMWLNVVFRKFLKVFQFKRHHTWMKAFGHDLPKPSDLMANFEGGETLVRIWSKGREKLNLFSESQCTCQQRS